MTYDAMPAGAEMDKLIAQRVMGYEWERAHATIVGSQVVFGTTWQTKSSFPWKPSTDIAQAFEVVKRLHQITGNSVMIMYSKDQTNCELEFAADGGSSTMDTYAETAPLAICRAALKAAAAKAEG
jgi:hypothetical protein